MVEAAATTHVWIDCDAGVDDAQALLLALADSRVKIAGVSCVAGCVAVDKVVNNVARVLTLCGRFDIPFYKGAAAPLLSPPKDASWFHGEDGLGDAPEAAPRPHDVVRKPTPGIAAVKLVEAAAVREGQLIVIALGPLTNLALACHLDPAFPKLVKRLVIMGSAETVGNVTPYAEFNIEHDAEAAHLVFRSFPRTTMVSWDCCLAHTLPWNVIDSWAALDTPKAAFLTAILEKSNTRALVQQDAAWTTADPLAVAVALRPELVLAAKNAHVEVELHGSLTRGMTVFSFTENKNKAFNAELVQTLNLPALIEMMGSSLR